MWAGVGDRDSAGCGAMRWCGSCAAGRLYSALLCGVWEDVGIVAGDGAGCKSAGLVSYWWHCAGVEPMKQAGDVN